MAAHFSLDVRIVVPVEDMADIPSPLGEGGTALAGRVGSIWPHVESSILDQVLSRRATIVFANSRGVAEKLTARLNELYADRLARQHGIAVVHTNIRYHRGHFADGGIWVKKAPVMKDMVEGNPLATPAPSCSNA